MKQKLIQIMQEYKNKGLMPGSELLLPPTEAIRMADDLANAGFVIMGGSGWSYWDRGNKLEGAREDIAVFSNYQMKDDEENAPQESAAEVKEFIATLPQEIDFVSLMVDVGDVSSVEWWQDVISEVKKESRDSPAEN